MTVRGPDALLAPLRAVLEGAPADEVELWAHRRVAAVTRYTRNAVHQNARSDETHVTARAVVGRAVGVATTNATDGAGLRALVADAAALARLQPPNEEWPGVAGPATYAAAHAFDEATASLDAAQQARAIARITARAEARGMRAAGTHHLELREDAVVTSRGAEAYAPLTLAYVRALVQSETGAGYADDLGARAGALDPDGVASRAIAKAELDRDRRQLEPGDHEAVFEELAVAEILRVLSLHGVGGQAVREGRSFMTGRIGERVTGRLFTLHDDALDARQLAIPFDVEGTPKRRVALLEDGIARGPVHDRTSAKAMGASSSGHAADRDRYPVGGLAANLVMRGGDASDEDLVRAVRRGVLITRFHYTNVPDPKSATMTGTSRDGTFLIEDGRIVAALANVRFTMSALDLFAGIELLGRQRLVRDWWSTNGMGEIVCLAPPMKVARATITGSSPL
ncbi:MAG TPA: metallopeptidase TldD-related protein [Candidatus Limnocylindria bacterium]|nr:metallopeptidase TldD-related protein [Candidatus Limnocylindria bacterium]